jgi:hypothetical protein
VEIGVADAARLDPEQRLPRAGRLELQLLDAEAPDLL